MTGPTPASCGPLIIRDARVIVTCPGRNFVTLKIETDQGVYGIGDATLNGRELSVASYLTDHVIPVLIGRDAHRIEDIWQYLYRGAYWRRGPVTMTAIAAVDTALWDIKGKAAGLPLYQLLGGRSREGVLVYGHANGADIEQTVETVGRDREAGYRAIRASGRVRARYTNPPTPRCRRRRSGRRPPICVMRPSCSKRSASPMARRSSCCTTSITG